LWVFLGGVWSIVGDALWLKCLQVVEYRLEEWEFGGNAINDVGDGSAVRVDVVMLLWGRYHRRRARPIMIAASSMWAGWEPIWVPLLRMVCLPAASFGLGNYGNVDVTRVVVGVALFLEYAEEVLALVYVDVVCGTVPAG
jgi:hypothetical protein